MRRYIILLFITGIVWAQTDYDTLVLIDKTVYIGRLVKYDNDEINFKVLTLFFSMILSSLLSSTHKESVIPNTTAINSTPPLVNIFFIP